MSKKTSAKEGKITPLMEQYNKVKQQHPDAVVLFQVGDFYETFGQDAIRASEILGIVLTHRNNGGVNVELAGFPHHSLDVYLPKLVRAGHRVAICQQLEKPSKHKKIVKRGITEIVTPGLTSNDGILDQRENNFLASLFCSNPDSIGLALLDVTTGEFLVTQGKELYIDKLLQSFRPTELIFSKDQKEFISGFIKEDIYQFGLDAWVFALDYGRDKLLDRLAVNNLKGFGIEEYKNAQIAAGAILHYLDFTENRQIGHINSIQRIQPDEALWLDRFTIRNLELLNSIHPQGKALIDIIDKTKTPMGGRQLRRWLVLPSKDLDTIAKRHEIVQFLVVDDQSREDWISLFSQITDIERLASKLAMNKIQPRELIHLKNSLQLIPQLKEILLASGIANLSSKVDQLTECVTLRERLINDLQIDPPSLASKGGVFRSESNEDLRDLRHVMDHAQQLLLNLQAKEAEKTGITSLKVGFNNVFGYYLEVTNKYKNLGLIPDHWTRKQTLTNAERYITEELKNLEEKVLNAKEESLSLEEKLYDQLLSFAREYIRPLQQNASIMADLDCLLGFSILAIDKGYCKPEVDDSYKIDIKKGRHPVIEEQLPLGESYVPNDVFLDNENQQILVITGPNMSGKSALLRQTALICLLSQMGSFVPAESANIGILDRIFTRVGASDNISSGESTFMVEMSETASIMNNISDRSLILLDEIGRGTSTYDGISIAWSITEFLHENAMVKPKTLFATHYHELNELSEKYNRIKNFHVATKETGDKVLFLRKLEPDGTAHSFGIHVAKMAGMPSSIIKRSNEILQILESKGIDDTGKSHVKKIQPLTSSGYQLEIFDMNDPAMKKLREFINELDPNRMTPIECMLKLKEIKDLLNHV